MHLSHSLLEPFNINFIGIHLNVFSSSTLDGLSWNWNALRHSSFLPQHLLLYPAPSQILKFPPFFGSGWPQIKHFQTVFFSSEDSLQRTLLPFQFDDCEIDWRQKLGNVVCCTPSHSVLFLFLVGNYRPPLFHAEFRKHAPARRVLCQIFHRNEAVDWAKWGHWLKIIGGENFPCGGANMPDLWNWIKSHSIECTSQKRMRLRQTVL